MGYEPLAWDSDFFGIPIGRAAAGGSASLKAAVEEADAERIACLYLLWPIEQLPQMHAALDLGFRPYDVRVKLSCSLVETGPGRETVREAGEADEAALAGLARERVRDTRFWADQRFPRERVEALYAEWLRRGSAAPPLRRTLVVGEAEGFVTCGLDAEHGVGRIELIAVSAAREGTGLGDALMDAAGRAFADAGLRRAEVVTQARNISAQRLYQRHGYRTAEAGVWLHRWRDA